MKRIGILDGPDGPPIANYHTAVRSCSAEPYLLVPDNYEFLLPHLHGIVVPGGDDINPQRYGHEAVGAYGWSDSHDAYELAVIEQAVSASLPILGICRGLQLINVFFGGTLQQDIDAATHKENEFGDKIHSTYAHGFVEKIYSDTRVIVNSAHHQAINTIGTGLKDVQWSDDDIIEAIEHHELPIIATQWHPERIRPTSHNQHAADGQEVFRYFINSVV